MFFALLLGFLTLSITVFLVNADPPCPDGWYHSAQLGQCYYKVDEIGSFERAKALCMKADNNSQLVSINTEVEYDLVSAYLDAENNHFLYPSWIGLQAFPDAPFYRWLDGTPANFTHWAIGAPDPKKESCFAWMKTGFIEGWLAINCKAPAQAVCKREAVYSNIIQVYGDDGQITSPSYPSPYPADVTTVYYINAYSGKYTTVTLPVVDIDSESVIYIYEGPSTSGHLLAIVKSGQKETTFTGYNGITVKFVSSATTSRQSHTGWVLNFSNVRIVHGNSNQVTSPNSPASYPPNTVTYYHINPNYSGLTVTSLPVFDIDSESVLYFYRGPDDSGPFVIATNASTGEDSSFISFNGITLKFVSSGGDGEKHAGWALNYYT